jgi:hypothetical protein
VKEKFERIHVADEREPVFESLQELSRCIDQEKLNGIFRAWVWLVQEVSQSKAMETTSDDK